MAPKGFSFDRLIPSLLYLGGVVAGLIIASLLLSGIQTLGHRIFPLPEGMKSGDLELMREAMAQVSPGALLAVLVSYLLGSFAGGYVAAWISKRYRRSAAVTVGLILMGLGLVNLLLLPHPWWFWIGWALVFVPPAWLGARLAPGPAPPTQPI